MTKIVRNSERKHYDDKAIVLLNLTKSSLESILGASCRSIRLNRCLRVQHWRHFKSIHHSLCLFAFGRFVAPIDLRCVAMFLDAIKFKCENVGRLPSHLLCQAPRWEEEPIQVKKGLYALFRREEANQGVLHGWWICLQENYAEFKPNVAPNSKVVHGPQWPHTRKIHLYFILFIFHLL